MAPIPDCPKGHIMTEYAGHGRFVRCTICDTVPEPLSEVLSRMRNRSLYRRLVVAGRRLARRILASKALRLL